MLRTTWILSALAGLLAYGCGSGANTGSRPQDNPAERITPGIIDAGPAVGTLSDPSQPAYSAEFPHDALVSIFSRGPGLEALTLYRHQEFALANTALQRALKEVTEPEEAEALRILHARILRELARWEESALLFANAVKGYPQIADYLHYEAARAFAMAGNPEASKHAELVDARSPWGPEREFLLAESARASGDTKRAAERYGKFIASDADPALQSEARYRLGEVLVALGEPESAKDQWRALLVSDPTSTWATVLRTQDKTLDASLSKRELLTRGMAYFHAMRNLESEADFSSALKKGKLSKEEHCQAHFHRAKSIFKERDYKRAAPHFIPAIAACKASGNTNYEVKSAYQAGLTYARLRKHEKSAKYFRYVEKYPKHSYADDARLRQAEQYTALGKDAKVRDLLSTIPKLYPVGDMRAEAMWRLARRAYLKKEYALAVKWLAEQIQIMPIERNWWAEGQAHYWMGRSLGKQGKDSEAASAYRECIRLYPLTYYSLQAFARLKEGFPKQHAEALAEVGSQASPWTGEFEDRTIYQTPGFRTALTLARLGIGDATRRQLAAIGMAIPEGRTGESDVSVIDRLVATSRILDVSGDYAHSHWSGRWHAVDYRRTWPTGANRERWRLAYPLAFWELLVEFADRYTYPPHLQMAIVREESAFDPSRESWANAIGLTQMIFPTAIDHSKESGIRVTRENLQHPVKNVTIGSHFLQSLQDGFDGRVGLMVPGYNAGRARVRGWIRQRSKYDLDEFIELIPGDQARRYTKRVLGSYFVYSYLDTHRVPNMRNAVPRKLGHL